MFICVGGIFKITDFITNDNYIGSVLSFEKRKYYRIYDLKQKKTSFINFMKLLE